MNNELAAQDDVLIFNHIYKTGGNTLLKYLAHQFSPEKTCMHQGINILDMSRHQISGYQLIAGHYPYSVRQYSSRSPKHCTLLRHPVRRAISLYGYLRSLAEHSDPAIRLARNCTFEEFVVHPIVLPRISNTMTWFLTCSPDEFLNLSTITGDKDLELAKTRLASMPFFGLTERFEDSVRLMHESMGWISAPQQAPQNVTRLPLADSEVSDDCIEQLQDINQLDLVLYKFAEKLFAERLSSTLEADDSSLATHARTTPDCSV